MAELPRGGALCARARGRRVLELGRAHGRSTVALAQSAGALVSVGTEDPGSARDWLERFGLAGRATLRHARFADVVPALGRFDVVFVDGDHDAASVRADVELALSVLNSGGVLACHDYPDPTWPGVRRTVDALAGAWGLVRIRQSDYLGEFRRPGPAP